MEATLLLLAVMVALAMGCSPPDHLHTEAHPYRRTYVHTKADGKTPRKRGDRPSANGRSGILSPAPPHGRG